MNIKSIKNKIIKFLKNNYLILLLIIIIGIIFFYSSDFKDNVNNDAKWSKVVFQVINYETDPELHLGQKDVATAFARCIKKNNKLTFPSTQAAIEEVIIYLKKADNKLYNEITSYEIKSESSFLGGSKTQILDKDGKDHWSDFAGRIHALLKDWIKYIS